MKTNLEISRHAAQSTLSAKALAVVSPDEMNVAVVADEGRIHYRSTCDDVLEHTFYICHGQALAFSEDGKLLAAAGARNGSQGKIKVWRLSDHKQLWKRSLPATT